MNIKYIVLALLLFSKLGNKSGSSLPPPPALQPRTNQDDVQ